MRSPVAPPWPRGFRPWAGACSSTARSQDFLSQPGTCQFFHGEFVVSIDFSGPSSPVLAETEKDGHRRGDRNSPAEPAQRSSFTICLQ